MTLDDIHSHLTTLLRYPRGYRASLTTRQPEAPLHLWEFEACPFCRKVREVLSELDLSYVCHPCARGSKHRRHVKEAGGRQMFPWLEDPNTGARMYESEDIITYLMETYGAGRSLASRQLSPLHTFTSSLASASRPRGRVARPETVDRPDPAQLLELYSFEISPYCRKVREVLAELDLPHLVHNVAKASPRRAELLARGGKVQVPYLIDPNTGAALYESDEINRYLRATYGGR